MLLLMYNAPDTINSLDDLRYVYYKKQVLAKNIETGSGFDLRALPPTSDAAKYHSYRAYLQVQQWLGNTDILPTDWGWNRSAQTDHLVPISKDYAAAPEKVLKMISCGCKQGCRRNCRCVKAGLLCTVLCSGCNGLECANSGHEENEVS